MYANTAVYIIFLLSSPPKMVHSPSGVAIPRLRTVVFTTVVAQFATQHLHVDILSYRSFKICTKIQ